MEHHEYQTMFELEDEYWWYVGLRDLLNSYLHEFKTKDSRTLLLDAGCGTGALLSMLGSYGVTYGTDLSAEALAFCRKRGLERITQASILQLPFQSGQFDCISSFDVLYHRAVSNDVSALKEYHRVLTNRGKLFLNLPAFEFLRSEHDRAIHTARRYTRRQVGEMLIQAGFQIEKMTYHNSFLFPFVLATRWMRRHKSQSEPARSDLTRLPGPINRFLTGLLKLENALVRKIDFPVGSSIFCMAVKPTR